MKTTVQSNYVHSIAQELIEEANKLLLINYEAVRKERFVKKTFCPHCMHDTGKSISNYVLFGFVNKTFWQRYRCRQCKRVFSDLTNTFFRRSRNVHKWPDFIQYVLINKLPLKQISLILKLHINTIYTWNKKLRAFFEQFLPNNNSTSFHSDIHDYTTLSVPCYVNSTELKNKINNKKSDQSSNKVTLKLISVPITIGFNRADPSYILFNLESNQEHIRPDQSINSKVLNTVIDEFNSFFSVRKKIKFENIRNYLIFFRMYTLCNVINPVRLSDEIMKICIDKGNLSPPKRLLKRLIN